MERYNPNKAEREASKPERTTTPIFPISIFNLETGVVNKVSIVPRSFSPVNKSIAGYIQPINPKAINT